MADAHLDYLQPTKAPDEAHDPSAPTIEPTDAETTGREAGGTPILRQRVAARDIFTAGEVLADQAGANAVLTFKFAKARQLIWVRCDGGQGRCDPFGGEPAAATGIRCDDGIPNPITVEATEVKVYAKAGTTVQVWGMSY